MNPYQTRGLTLDPGVTALALRGLRERGGHYPFIARAITRRRRQGLVVSAGSASSMARIPRRTYFAVVRRGNEEVFRKLTEHFQADPEVKVIWDRRVGERRSRIQSVGAERRRNDRRCTVPSLWENADYVLVPQARWFARCSRLRGGSAAWLGPWRRASRLFARRRAV